MLNAVRKYWLAATRSAVRLGTPIAPWGTPLPTPAGQPSRTIDVGFVIEPGSLAERFTGCGEKPSERVDIHRFGEVTIESGFRGASFVFPLSQS